MIGNNNNNNNNNNYYYYYMFFILCLPVLAVLLLSSTVINELNQYVCITVLQLTGFCAEPAVYSFFTAFWFS
jgi:hypothetical protein